MGATCFCSPSEKKKNKIYNYDLKKESDYFSETPEKVNQINNNDIYPINTKNSKNLNSNENNVNTPNNSITNLKNPKSYINSNMNIQNTQSNNINNSIKS